MRSKGMIFLMIDKLDDGVPLVNRWSCRETRLECGIGSRRQATIDRVPTAFAGRDWCFTGVAPVNTYAHFFPNLWQLTGTLRIDHLCLASVPSVLPALAICLFNLAIIRSFEFHSLIMFTCFLLFKSLYGTNIVLQHRVHPHTAAQEKPGGQYRPSYELDL
ncbi:hypothetical protein HAX54_029524 [Datura stramonium]|uniref:Uncharacterized protein n=1 Tax=Datura stramonium TaxID=4076 RepID=A0ABS8V7J0_DATST|nr:hypothetical protein [Datura stramonium]